MEQLTGDVLDIYNEYGSYQEYKESLDADFQEAAERFVIIGYKLKVARDTNILQESGYKDVNEFAQAEYSLDKSQVSRFIRINHRFSENGYSKRLKQEYRNLGYTKLALMLHLPDEINEELTSGYSKAEIQTIKDEYDEERKVTDLEVMMEEKDGRQQACGIFGKVLYQIGKDNPETYLQMYEASVSTVTNRGMIDALMDALAPAGEAIISARVPGEGRKMLSIKGTEIDPVVVDVRSVEKVSCTWDDLVSEVETLCMDAEDARKAWEILYEEPFPEKKQEVAPVQPKKEQETRKASKVTKAKIPEETREEMEQEGSEKTMPAAGQQEPNMEEQEAAGGENEESGKNETKGEACAVSEKAGESSTEPEHADEEDGAAGGAGEGSPCGGEDGEKLRAEENVLKIQYCELRIKNALGVIEGYTDRNNWKGIIEKAQEIIEKAQEIIEKAQEIIELTGEEA